MIKNGEIYGEKCRLVKYCVFKTVQGFGDKHFISALSIKEANNTRAYLREVYCWRYVADFSVLGGKKNVELCKHR